MDSFSDLPAATAPPDPTQPFSGNSAHPPYPEMIVAAIAALEDNDGSSRQAIAKYIERQYSNLPPTHPNLLTHHLKQMKNQGDLTMIKHSYALPPPRSVPFQSPPPQPVMDNHFTQYSITAADSVTPRRKPGRPPKPRHDFGYQEHQPEAEIHPYQPQFEHPGFQTQTVTNLGQGEVQGSYADPPIFASLGLTDAGVTPPAPEPENAVVSAKRSRGRPPKGAITSAVAKDNANASGGTGTVGGLGSSGSEGRRKRGRPRLMSISRVNGGVVKRGRPKRIGGAVTVPLSGNVTSPRGRPKRVVSGSQAVSGDNESGSVSRGRGRPPKNKFRNSFGQHSKVGPGTAVIVTDPHQLVAYQELKSKYEHLQSKAREVVGVVRPYVNPDYEAFGALQELETLVGTGAIVQSDNQQQSYV